MTQDEAEVLFALLNFAAWIWAFRQIRQAWPRLPRLTDGDEYRCGNDPED
jgi:hypothetical protein